jgi:hypothetical protein
MLLKHDADQIVLVVLKLWSFLRSPFECSL